MPEPVAVGPTFSVASTGQTVPGRETPVPGDTQVRSGIRTDDGGAYAGIGVFLPDHFHPASCIPRVRVFRRQVPGTGYQVSGTGYLAPGTWYPAPEPNRRRGPNTEHRGPKTRTPGMHPVSCIHIRSDTKSRGPTPGRPGSPAPWVPSDRSPASPIIMGVMQLTGRSLAGVRHGVRVPGLRYPALGVLGPGSHRSWAPDTRYLTSGARRRDDGPDAHGDLTGR